jgi:hypothetical protein
MTAITYAANSVSFVNNGVALTDFLEGDFITIAPVNPITSHVNGSNGSVNINRHNGADVHDVTVRTPAHSDTDIFLNNAKRNPDITVLNGSLKENFKKDGVPGIEDWILKNGSVITGSTITKNNTDGNSVSEYVIRYRTAIRNI